MNVLKDFPYRPRYYLTHPWKFIDECWTNLKNAWMRVTRGWSYMDLYNMDNYLTDVMIDMLRTLAREAHEYPGIEPFETPEKWTSWLWYIAGELEASKEEFYEGKNEFKEEYYKELDNWKIDFEKDENGNLISKSRELSDVAKKYFARDKELAEEAEKRRYDAMQQLNKYVRWLWD